MGEEVEIIVEIDRYENDIREVDIHFPVYIKSNYSKSKCITYKKFVDRYNYFEVYLPKDTSREHAQFFYNLEFNRRTENDSYANPYRSYYREYTSFITQGEFDNALKRYQEEFLNKI